MTERELLRVQFGAVYDAAAANVEGMTHQDSLAGPSRGGNCANWILSHLVYVQNGIMEMLGADPVWENDRLAPPRSAPITRADEALEWSELRDRFLGSRERCLEAIARLHDDRLREEVPNPVPGVTTRGQLLAFLAFHQAYHVGQLGLARRVAGLEGAIRGPAPSERDRTRGSTASGRRTAEPTAGGREP